jgi:hypothetical protein
MRKKVIKQEQKKEEKIKGDKKIKLKKEEKTIKC